jgi:phosphate-selective porin
VSKANPIHFTPHFSSWDIEGQYFLTNDYEPFDNYHGYYGQVRPSDPVTKGGIGAIGLTARVDEANLNDAKYGVHGGNETNLTLGVSWFPTSYTRVNVNYVRMFPIGGGLTPNRGKNINAVAMRLEFIY